MARKLNTVTGTDGTVTITMPGVAGHAFIGQPMAGSSAQKFLWKLKTPTSEQFVETWALPRITVWAQGYFFALEAANQAAPKKAETPKVEIVDTRKQ